MLVPLLHWRRGPEGRAARPPLWRDGWFRAGCLIALVLVVAWPLLQTVRFGRGFYDEAIGRQLADRLAPWGAGTVPSDDPRWAWVHWVRRDARVVWIFSAGLLMATFLVPRLRRDRRLMSLVLLVLSFGVVMTLAPGPTHPRYLLAMVPFLAVVAAVVATRLSPRPALVAVLCIGLLAANAKPLRRVLQRNHTESRAVEIALAQRFGREIEPQETPVFVRPLSGAFPYALFLVYSATDRTAIIVRRGDWSPVAQWVADDPELGPPYRGIATVEDLPAVAAHLGPVDTLSSDGTYVVFRSRPR